MQTGDFDRDLSVFYSASKENLICNYFWQKFLDPHSKTEIYVDAQNIFKGRGRLYELSDEELIFYKNTFESYVKLSMSQRGHELFETIEIPIGVYELQLHAMNDQPGPVEIKVYNEIIPIGTLKFTKDDGSWETKSLLLLPMHWNIQNGITDRLKIRITFENAATKRVANIAWLRIKSLSGSEFHE